MSDPDEMPSCDLLSLFGPDESTTKPKKQKNKELRKKNKMLKKLQIQPEMKENEVSKYFIIFKQQHTYI